MKLNYKKTKLIIFDPCKSLDFIPEISLKKKELEVVEEIRLLGVLTEFGIIENIFWQCAHF